MKIEIKWSMAEVEEIGRAEGLELTGRDLKEIEGDLEAGLKERVEYQARQAGEDVLHDYLMRRYWFRRPVGYQDGEH